MRAREALPFGLCRQPGLRPTRVRIRLEETDMTHGCMRIDGLHSIESECLPAAVARFPIERRIPALGVFHIPPFGQPEFGTRIPIVSDELRKLRVADRLRCNLESIDKHPMPGALIVKVKAVTLVTDLSNAIRRCPPRDRRHRSLHRNGTGPIAWSERIAGK